MSSFPLSLRYQFNDTEKTFFMRNFQDLTGYNANKLVKENHVFIPGDGCWYETKELAREHNPLHDIGVGHFIIEREHEGVTIYQENISNVWN